MVKVAKLIELKHQIQYRIIPSVYPPINFFEGIVEASEMEALFEIESMTNDRLRQEVGDVFLVPVEDRVSGPGSSVVMAAFTHIGKVSRFTDGSYGIYYAGFSLETAIRETVFHRENFLRATNEEAGDITMRVYEGKIIQPLHDIRSKEYIDLHHAEDWKSSQKFAREMKKKNSWGLVYNSVRHAGGTCIAVFRPPAVSNPKQSLHLKYHWNGDQVTAVSSTEIVLELRGQTTSADRLADQPVS